MIETNVSKTDVMSLISWNYLNHQILSDQSDKRGKPSLWGMFFQPLMNILNFFMGIYLLSFSLYGGKSQDQS